MEYRPVGATGLDVSALSFGCGPVPALLTGENRAAQIAAVERALEAGVNWFDTAATYGEGRSEKHLGMVLRAIGSPEHVHFATKVRLDLAAGSDAGEIRRQVRASLESSLERLGVERVSLLQLHNAITRRRGDLPTSIALEDVLGAGGVAEVFVELRREGRIAHCGLTGIGDPRSLSSALASGAFETVQAPFNVLDPGEAGRTPPGSHATDPDDGNLLAVCRARRIGFFAIRVYAGGALLDREPSEHTRRTQYFPLELYESDRRRARALAALCPRLGVCSLQELALRFALGADGIASAIVGFSSAEHVDSAVRCAQRGPLERAALRRLDEWWRGSSESSDGGDRVGR